MGRSKDPLGLPCWKPEKFPSQTRMREELEQRQLIFLFLRTRCFLRIYLLALSLSLLCRLSGHKCTLGKWTRSSIAESWGWKWSDSGSKNGRDWTGDHFIPPSDHLEVGMELEWVDPQTIFKGIYDWNWISVASCSGRKLKDSFGFGWVHVPVVVVVAS